MKKHKKNNKHNKSWFTLIELIIVITIIGIIFLSSKKLFQPQNRDMLYANSCINNLHWELTNYINTSFTSKWIAISWNIIYPDSYIINFDSQNNTIKLEYKTKNQTWIRKSLNLNENLPVDYYCKTSRYTIKLSWDSPTIKIKKWFQKQWTKPSFQIINNQIQTFIQNIPLYLCQQNATFCQNISLFTIDVRTKKIIKKTCKEYTGTNNTTCLQRNK